MSDTNRKSSYQAPNYPVLHWWRTPWGMITRLQLSFISTAKPCYHYNNLSDASRNRINVKTLGQALCDNELLEGWYRFVGAAGTKMPTTRVPRNRCGTQFSGWLNGIHPTVEDGEVYRKVCFSKLFDGCKYSNEISVKNCGSYFIYKLQQLPPDCKLRYCGTDWME